MGYIKLYNNTINMTRLDCMFNWLVLGIEIALIP